MAAASGNPQPFRTTLEPHRDTIVLAAHGDLDMASAPALRARLAELVDAGFARIVLDLRGATFLDSSGLRAILEAHGAARERGLAFALIAGPPAVQRVLELTGVETALAHVDPHTLQ